MPREMPRTTNAMPATSQGVGERRMVAGSCLSLAETYEAYKVIHAASLQLLERVFREFSVGQPRDSP